jgi:hypothetical protein
MHCLTSSLDDAALLQLVVAAIITDSLEAFITDSVAAFIAASIAVDSKALPFLAIFGRKMTTNDWANCPNPLDRGMETPIQYVPEEERLLMHGTIASVLKSRTDPWMRKL